MDTDTREPELDTLNTRPWIRRSCAPRAGQSRPDPARPAIMMMIMIMIIHAERDQRHSHCGQSRPGPTGPARSIPLPLPRAFSLRRGGARTVGPPRDEPPQLSPGRRCRPSESTRRRCSPRPPPRRCGSSRPCRRGPPSRPNRPPAPPHPPHAPHAAFPPPRFTRRRRLARRRRRGRGRRSLCRGGGASASARTRRTCPLHRGRSAPRPRQGRRPAAGIGNVC